MSAIISEKLYPLDWATTDIRLAKKRFTHTLQRPSAEMLLEREDELETETPIAKDGSYSLPDPTAQEAIDAKYSEKLCTATTGYTGLIPNSHRAAAFQGLFQREIYVADGCDVFGDEIVVLEEVGAGDEPEFIIRHILRGADEAEVNKFRQRSNNGKLHPDKRGRQKFVQKSNLRASMAFYQDLLKRIDGVKIGEEAFTDERRDHFAALVSPLIQRAVVKAYVEALTNNLLD